MALHSRTTPAWPMLALLCLAPQAHAARVMSVAVRRQGARFVLGMRLRIDAPPADVFRALQDYAALSRYTPDVRTLHIVRTSRPGRVLLFTTLHACVLFFCKTMLQEQIMTATADPQGGVLRSRLVPQGSDFKEGHGYWTVAPCRAHPASTCVNARLEMVPRFWVPPLIGPWLIRRKLRMQAHDAGVGLQQIAQRDARYGEKLESTRRHLNNSLILNYFKNFPVQRQGPLRRIRHSG